MRQKLSVLMIVKNGEKTVRKALESVEFADQLVVIDMKSSDDTAEIAREFTQNIYEVDDLGLADPARSFGLSKTIGQWVLILDSDEEISPKLQVSIKKILQTDQESEAKFTGFAFPRKNLIFGEWVKDAGWWPDYQVRLFKKDCVEFPSGIHQQPIVDGSVKELGADGDCAIIHHHYQSVEEFVERMNRYTTIQAQNLSKLQSKNQDQSKFSSAGALQEFFNEFLKRGFAEKGFFGGLRATSLSLLQSNYQLLVFLKEWELSGKTEKKLVESVSLDVLTKFSSDFKYWLADAHVAKSRGLSKLYWQIRRKLKL